MTRTCGCHTAGGRSERHTLRWLLTINGLMGVIEVAAGWLAQSTGLLADSLDMFADAAVYGVALSVVGKNVRSKTRAALLSGLFQMAFSGFVVIDVLRRFVGGGEPMSSVMFLVALLALLANAACLALIAKHRHGEVHMRASWIFSANDALANLGVMVAGIAVHLTGSRLPDLVIGAVIAALVLYGGLRIVKDARGVALRDNDGTGFRRLGSPFNRSSATDGGPEGARGSAGVRRRGWHRTGSPGGDQILVAQGLVNNGGFKHPVEHHPAAAETAVVEAEQELVQVAGQVRTVHGALVGTRQPPLGQRSDPVHSGQ